MKQIRWIFGIMVLVLTLIWNVSFTSNAYTEEEKRQAKAWLSAHGYSPDQAGANQAYQDYLNGKFDEELGIDTNGDGVPASTQATAESTTQTTTETVTGATTEMTATVEPDKEKPTEEKTTQEKTSETADSEKKDATGNVISNDNTEETTDTDVEKEEKTAEGTGEREDSMESASEDTPEQEESEEESTLLDPEKKEEYQIAGLVIVLAVVILLLAGLHFKK